MHRQAKVCVVTIAAAVVFGNPGSLSAQAGGGGRGPQDPPVVAYRKALMQIGSQHIAAITAALTGQIGSKDDIRMHAIALENDGKMFASIFPEGSTAATSRAKDDIWTDEADFQAKLRAFSDAVHTFRETAEQGAVTEAALEKMHDTCTDCHDRYRKPAQPPQARGR